MRMPRLGALVAVILLISSVSACALDDIQGVGAVWNDFVAALRRGDYHRAHGLFSAQSRAAMPFAEFVREYGPVSAAREMVLAKPDSLATTVEGDWGEVTYGGVNPGTGRTGRVGGSGGRPGGGWGVVAARNETVERVEAGARGLLRLLWENRMHGAPRDLVAALTAAQAGNPVLRFFRLETDGRTFQAFPVEKVLRAFFVDGFGVVRAVERTREEAVVVVPERSVLPRVSVVEEEEPREERMEFGEEMPELSEPDGEVFGSGLELGDEWEEPPLEGVGQPMVKEKAPASRLPVEPVHVELPDLIR